MDAMNERFISTPHQSLSDCISNSFYDTLAANRHSQMLSKQNDAADCEIDDDS